MLFNTIFKLKEYDLIISENVFNKLDNDYVKKILINMCKILSLRESDKINNDIGGNNNNNNDLIANATSERKLQKFFDKYYNKILRILIAKKDFKLMEVFVENILRYISQREIPVELVKYFFNFFLFIFLVEGYG